MVGLNFFALHDLNSKSSFENRMKDRTREKYLFSNLNFELRTKTVGLRFKCRRRSCCIIVRYTIDHITRHCFDAVSASEKNKYIFISFFHSISRSLLVNQTAPAKHRTLIVFILNNAIQYQRGI